MKKEFEIRLYDDGENLPDMNMIIEVSKIHSYEILQRIINFLERIRE